METGAGQKLLIAGSFCNVGGGWCQTVRRVYCLYWRFLDGAGRELQVGGVETYLWQLTRLCADLGYEPVVVQSADIPFDRSFDHLRVIGVDTSGINTRRVPRVLFKAIAPNLQRDDILIFGADHCSVPVGPFKAISIQHGVFWDLPCRFLTNRRIAHSGLFGSWYKMHVAHQARRLFENCDTRVCVDHNFLNWYRTLRSGPPGGDNWVIPNFTELAPPAKAATLPGTQDQISILFARRFVEYRGTKLMAAATSQLLSEYPRVTFTFAGDGPDSSWLRTRFDGCDRVDFIRYHPKDALGQVLRHDISVIPSLASEGTSLAVAEAMGAGRVVVASHVGGITNMIIDNYNGLLVIPEVLALVAALRTAIGDPGLRRRLGSAAYETASRAFGISTWRASWSNVIRAFERRRACMVSPQGSK